MTQIIYLLDTNVISELVKKTPDPHVLQWLQTVDLLAISAITVEEVRFGQAWQPNTGKLALVSALIDQLHTVYAVTASIAARAGVLRGQFQAQGISRTSPDMLIAATAQEHQLVLVTRDVRDFTGCGVQVMNPFSMPA